MSETRPSFTVIASGPTLPTLTPGGEAVHELWWDEAIEPEAQIPFEKSAKLIGQIDEPGGKQSCYLTAQLNALILRDALSPQEADFLQTTFATDDDFSQYWRDQMVFGRDYTAWSSRPHDTAYAITVLTGRRIAMSMRRIEDPASLEGLLDDGYALVIGDGRHSRTAFKPADGELPYVFDSKYPESTGFYVPTELRRLQADPYVVVV